MPISAVPDGEIGEGGGGAFSGDVEADLAALFLEASAREGTSLAPSVSEPRMRSVVCAWAAREDAMTRVRARRVCFM
jgi:hypothetical protein